MGNLPKTEFDDRRVFITTASKSKYFDLFRFTQSRNDGSLYVIFHPDSKGKYSFHGRGETRYREHAKPGEPLMVLSGSKLLDLQNDEIGVRHLFTVQLNQPLVEPSSPFGSRRSDYAIQSLETELIPVNFIFFAVPKQADLKFEFPIDTVSPKYLGGHYFELLYHRIFWLAYTDDKQKTWFKDQQIHLADGYLMPLAMVTREDASGIKTVIVNYLTPRYSISGSTLTISLAP